MSVSSKRGSALSTIQQGRNDNGVEDHHLCVDRDVGGHSRYSSLTTGRMLCGFPIPAIRIFRRGGSVAGKCGTKVDEARHILKRHVTTLLGNGNNRGILITCKVVGECQIWGRGAVNF